MTEFNEPETIVNRLRGIYDTGPANNPQEFRREFPDRPPINYEAARRIEALEGAIRVIADEKEPWSMEDLRSILKGEET